MCVNARSAKTAVGIGMAVPAMPIRRPRGALWLQPIGRAVPAMPLGARGAPYGLQPETARQLALAA